ncbi:hypothetical protein Agub_g15653, partial [Astrephomene gubernaculifera]
WWRRLLRRPPLRRLGLPLSASSSCSSSSPSAPSSHARCASHQGSRPPPLSAVPEDEVASGGKSPRHCLGDNDQGEGDSTNVDGGTGPSRHPLGNVLMQLALWSGGVACGMLLMLGVAGLVEGTLGRAGGAQGSSHMLLQTCGGCGVEGKGGAEKERDQRRGHGGGGGKEEGRKGRDGNGGRRRRR